MRKEKFLKSFYALLLLVAGMSFVACSEEPIDGPGSNGNGNVTAYKPGDDFYMYVNADWHKELPSQLAEPQGWVFSAAASVDEKSHALLNEMEERRIIQESHNRLMNGELDANIAYVDSILNIVRAEINAAEDIPTLGRLLGKYISKGYADCLLRLYTAFSREEDKVCFTIAPDMDFGKMINTGGEEEGGEPEESRMYGNTRSTTGNNFFNYVLEGLGPDFDPELFVMEDTLKRMYEQFNDAPLEDLKENITNSVVNELYLYCGDAKTLASTNGGVATTYEALQKMLPSLLSYPLSYYFCEKYVNDELKAEYTAYAETMREVLHKRIEASAWLSATTKEAALTKLDSMKFFIGEPDSWDMESFPKLRGNLLVEDILETKQARIRAIKSLLGKSKKNEAMTACILAFEGVGPYVYNAAYLPETNAVLMLPAFMMEPEYTPGMDAAKKYAMFYVIGHEMTHGFDLKGSKYDAYGNLSNWWEQADKERFNALNNKLAEQISTFEIAPGFKTDGHRTITEDVADLGGLNIALDALNDYLREKGATDEEVKEAQKTFFKYHAFRYRVAYSQDYFQNLLLDVHSPGMVRVNGMVQHMDKWYELFDVQEGDKLYLPAEERITIW